MYPLGSTPVHANVRYEDPLSVILNEVKDLHTQFGV